MSTEKEEVVLCEILYKKGSSFFELMRILRSFYNERETEEILNKAAKNILMYHAYEDRFILEKLLKSRKGKSFLSEQVHCVEDLLQSVFKFLDKLVSMNFSEETPYNECVLEEVEEVLNGDTRRVIQYQWTLKKLEENIRFLCLKGDFVAAHSNYLRYMRTTYGLISLISFDELRFLDEELKRDPLTGALSRRVLKGIFKGILELSLISEIPFTVALIDVDNFKKVNDTYGHKIGDCVLRKLVEVLRKNLRKGDYLFRYGGEEFLLVIPSAGKKEGKMILEKLRKKVEETKFLCDGHELQVTVSIGAYSGVYDGGTPYYEYIKLADENLYKAKRSGKNKVII